MALVGAQFVNAVSPNPVGSLQAYAGASAPTGWLLCDGSEQAITTYPELYSVLGTTYGALTNGSGGAGSTHFRVPDLRGRMPIGAGNEGVTGNNTARTRGAKGGDTRMPIHTHTANTAYPASFGGAAVYAPYLSNTSIYTNDNQTLINQAGSGTGDNMPPFLVTNYIIKAVPDAPRSGLAYGSTPPIVTALPANPQFGEQVLFYSTTPYAGYQLQQWTGASWTILDDSRGIGAWQSYTPQVDQGASTDIGKTVGYAKFIQVGKTVTARVRMDMTASGSAGSVVSVTAPVPCISAVATNYVQVGSGAIYDASATTRYLANIQFQNDTSKMTFIGDWSANSSWGGTPNIALGSGDQIAFQITYEAA